ncbi:hypothetical protein [Salegentibacter chungangensis]|uniref:NIPSNAP domain-containing protein n=1 Tax=Salegentibacter chungangensis TaxID=1335724 RepID=A0ABW3NPN2_9FLAO
MKTMKITLILAAFLFCGQGLFAQEMGPKKYENPNWIYVSFIKFHPGKKDKAVKIIDDYFAKADANAGISPPTVLNMTTGDFDFVVVWKLEEGIETLNYEISPDDAKWYAEMGKLAGGMDKAEEVMQEFFSYVEMWKTEIGRME